MLLHAGACGGEGRGLCGIKKGLDIYMHSENVL